MNRKHVIIFVLLVVLTGLFIVAWTYPRFKIIRKEAASPEGVAAILAGNVDMTISTIGNTFNEWSDLNRIDRTETFHNKFPAESRWSRFFLFHNETGPSSLFPDDEELLRGRGMDSSVERYIRIPSDRRTHDLYLYEPSGDYFWESEYIYDDHPAKFRCSFIIHMEPIDQANTKVEVFEYQPTIWAGEYLGISAHSILPAMLHDIRPVEATTTDRKAVLLLIQKSQASLNDDSPTH
jgi:hypothetical protein